MRSRLEKRGQSQFVWEGRMRGQSRSRDNGLTDAPLGGQLQRKGKEHGNSWRWVWDSGSTCWRVRDFRALMGILRNFRVFIPCFLSFRHDFIGLC